MVAQSWGTTHRPASSPGSPAWCQLVGAETWRGWDLGVASCCGQSCRGLGQTGQAGTGNAARSDTQPGQPHLGTTTQHQLSVPSGDPPVFYKKPERQAFCELSWSFNEVADATFKAARQACPVCGVSHPRQQPQQPQHVLARRNSGGMGTQTGEA